MVLLNFSSAFNYILSLMLAILGIIPFENVKSPSQEVLEPVIISKGEPLSFAENISFSTDDFFASNLLQKTEPLLISLRNEYKLVMDYPKEEACRFVYYTSKIENVTKKNEVSKILIIYPDDRKKMIEGKI